MLKENGVVLFQGDSVTDCGRSREDEKDMGNGYPLLISSWFQARYPEKNIRFINKGISGNRVSDLESRWDADCINLEPAFVSILIGINDTWRRYDNNDPTSVQDFENTYRKIILQVKEKTNAEIMLCEPFVLPVPEDRKQWREDLDPKIHAIRSLAREFHTLLLPLDGLINSAAAQKSPETWAADGVHPTMAGHALIAQEWIRKAGF
jgi:acyl-CoA thioesterase-1